MSIGLKTLLTCMTKNLLKVFFKQNLYRIVNNPISRSIYNREISRRKKLSFADIDMLAANINILSPYSSEINMPNDFYGHAKVLKEFLGLKEKDSFKFIIEHGIALSNYVNDLELESGLNSIVTFSDFRKDILKKFKKHSFAIGPIIHYAKGVLSNKQIEAEKKRLGKTLLVFPSHATLDVRSQYDMKEFGKFIKSYEKSFQTIRVCLYWKDILDGLGEYYKDQGFECVTAGHILDPLFLPRLKSIIECADYSVSNEAGTHIGYCVYLKVPHYIFEQKQVIQGKKKEVERAYKILNTPGALESYYQVVSAFTKKTSRISARQKHIANLYWGFDQIKSHKKLMEIVNFTEKIYQQGQL